MAFVHVERDVEMGDPRFYRHSGKVALPGLVLGAAASFIGAPLLGVLYALATYYMPSVYVNAVLTVLFGLGIGFGVGYAMRFGHARNSIVMMAAAFAAALVAHYVGWMTWVAIVFRDLPDVSPFAVLNPLFLAEAVVEIADTGAWTIRGKPVNGGTLWVIWSIELLIVLGGALFGAFVAASSAPYCERCKRWCRSYPRALRLAIGPSTDRLASRVEQHDLGALAEHRNAEPHAVEWVEVEMEACEGCGGTNTLSLTRVKVGRDAKGNEKRNEEQLVQRLLVSSEQLAWVKGLASREAPMAAATSSV